LVEEEENSNARVCRERQKEAKYEHSSASQIGEMVLCWLALSCPFGQFIMAFISPPKKTGAQKIEDPDGGCEARS
jgi:hypothetical protein